MLESFSDFSDEHKNEIEKEAISKGICIFDALVDAHQEKHDLHQAFFEKDRSPTKEKCNLYLKVKSMFRYKKRK